MFPRFLIIGSFVSLLGCGDDSTGVTDGGLATDGAAPHDGAVILDGSAQDGGAVSDGSIDEVDGGTARPCGDDEVCNSLSNLGVTVDDTPRQDELGNMLPDDYNPLGQAVTPLFKLNELFLGGLAVQGQTNKTAILETHDDASETDGLVLNTDTDTAWLDATYRAAAAGDIDADGLDELLTVYRSGSNLRLRVRDDQTEAFAVTDIDLGAFSVDGLAVASGNVDSDAADELVLAVGQTPNAKLVFVDDEATTYAVLGSLTQDLPRTVSGSRMTFSIAAGNLDRDVPEETVVVVNEDPSSGFGDGSVASYFVFDDLAQNAVQLITDAVTGRDGSLYDARTADVALSDIDADGRSEILLAGLHSQGEDPVELILVALDDADHDFVSLAAKHTEDYRDETSNSNPPDYRAVFINTLDIDGDLTREIQVNQFVFDDLTNGGTRAPQWVERFEISNENFQRDQGFDFDRTRYAMATGDFTGDKKDDIVFIEGYFDELRIYGLNERSIFGELGTVDLADISNEAQVKPLLVPLNVDEDTPLLEFSEAASDLLFTEPILIAALAAPPCEEGIGQNTDACTTSYGKSTSVSIEEEEAVTLSVSTTVGVSFEDRLFTQSALEISATAEFSTTHLRTEAYSYSKSVVFTTGVLEDSVVFTTIPYDRYTYTIVNHPQSELIGETVTISVPREPVTLMVERSFYNAHIPPDAISIDDAIFSHTVGNRDSYPTIAQRDALLDLYGGLVSDEVSSPQGTGSVEVALDVGNEYGTGQSLEMGFEMSVSLTAGGVMAGFSVGASTSSSLSVTNGMSHSYAGGIGAIDEANFSEQLYNAGLFTYVYPHTSGQQFHVLNYWTR